MALLQRFFSSKAGAATSAHALYVKTVAQARQPAFYEKCGVYDSVQGRFEMLCLVASLVLHRLSSDEDENTKKFAQTYFDIMFADMDRNLREMGIGDTVIGKRIKKIAHNFYGRLRVYEKGMNDQENLEEALKNNLYDETPDVQQDQMAAIIQYIQNQVESLKEQDIKDLLKGDISFIEVENHG